MVAAAVGLGSGSGCPSLSPYVCGGDQDCDRSGRDGICLVDGVCAYPDDSDRCDSGLVRSPNAAVDPGACVPIDPEGTGPGTGVGPGPGTATTDDAGSGDTGDVATCGWRVEVVVDTAVLSPGNVLEGYPLLVSFTAPGLVTAIEATESEPFVTAADGTPLPHEWEALDPSTGDLSVWVRMPVYAAGELVPLQIRFDSPPPPNDPVALWEGEYVGVWHLSDALTGLDGDPIRNSVRVNEPGFTGGQMQPEQSVPGLVGRGLHFDGDDDIVSIDASYVGQLESYAISFWARYDGTGEVPSSYFARLNGGAYWPRCWRLMQVDGGEALCQYNIAGDSTPMNTGSEHLEGQTIHMVLTRDVDALRTELWRDGELVGSSDDIPGDLASGDNPFEIGHGEWGTYSGMLDEFRVRDRPLSAAWIEADYRTQLNPASVLLEVGEVEAVPCGP